MEGVKPPLHKLINYREQDYKVASKLRKGNVTDLKYNSVTKQTDVFYKGAFIGSIEYVTDNTHGVVKSIEIYKSKYIFSFKIITKEEFDNYLKKNGLGKYKPVKLGAPLNEDFALGEEEIVKSGWFTTIGKAFDFYLMVKKDTITGFFFDVLMGKTESQKEREKLQSLINGYLRVNPTDKVLKQMSLWNQDERLLKLMKSYHAKEKNSRLESKQERKWSNSRNTHCWSCRTSISTSTHGKCSKCKWIICSCGKCSPTC